MSLKRYTRDVVLLGMVLATVVAVFLSDINDIQAQIALPSDPAAQQAQATAQNNQNALDNVAQQGPAFQICDVTDTCYPLSQPVCTVSHPDPNFSGTYRISYDGQEQMTGGNIPTNYSTTQIVQLFRDQCTHRYILEQQCANACWTNIIMAPIRMSGAPPLSAAAFTGVACSTYNSNETSGNTNCSGIVPTGVIGNAGSTPPNNTTPRPQCVPDLLCSPTSANQCGTDCDGCLEPDGSPNVRNTDGTSCWRLKSGQPNYCERIPNCPFRFPPTAGYPVTMARQPLDWE